jgi:glycosyltransferase involved in cell wall biosynthesis
MLFATLRSMPVWLRQAMEAEGVPCFTCESPGRALYGAAVAQLARFLRRSQVDVVHVHLFDPSLVGLTAGLLAGTPMRVMTRHYSDYHTRIGRRAHVALDRLCLRMSHAVIAVSRHTAEHLVRAEGARPAKIHTVWNGIDFDRVRFSSPEAPAAVRACLVPEGGLLLLIAARLHPEKGYEHLFRALPELRRRVGSVFRLAVAGTGPLEPHYRAMVDSLGCQDVVRFLGFRRDLPDLIGAADLLVLPSVAEAFGLVLAESLYLGTPVVASRVGGIPEIIDDGQDGVLVPPGDASALAQAVAELLADPGRRRRLAGAGRAKVAERFGFPRMVRSYETIYDDLAASRRS